MPILKNEPHGRHDNATILVFGTGDIKVTSGHNSDNSKIKVVAFGQAEPKDISEWENTMPCANTDELDNLVIMEFSRPESIDIIIKSLKKAKEELLKDIQDDRL